MKYFLHDTNAFQDEKITELFIQFGYEGIGLFFTILERLAAQEKPIKTSVLKKQLMVGKKLEKVWVFLEEVGLISTKNDETFNVRMNSYLESFEKKRNDTRKRVSQHRDSQEDVKNVTRYNRVSNAPKVKKNNIDTNVSIEATLANADNGIDMTVKKNGNGQMIKPNLDSLTAYILTREGGTKAMAEAMFDFYTSKGWKVGKDPMTDWNAAARRWVKNNLNPTALTQPRQKQMVV